MLDRFGPLVMCVIVVSSLIAPIAEAAPKGTPPEATIAAGDGEFLTPRDVVQKARPRISPRRRNVRADFECLCQYHHDCSVGSCYYQAQHYCNSYRDSSGKSCTCSLGGC